MGTGAVIGVGLLLFFLVPGLLAYAALYGLFHSGKTIAPEPPGVNTIEASVVVLLCSAAAHVLTTLLFAANAKLCQVAPCPLTVPAAWLDPYARAFEAVERKGIATRALGGLLALALAQGGLAYVGVRTWLKRLAKADRLPAWLYGWAVGIANKADNPDMLVAAHVLTTHDHDGRAVVYQGQLFDMALKPDGAIARLTLLDCDRGLADLTSPAGTPSIVGPLSRLPFLMIEASQIRNVVFRTARVDPGAPDPAPAVAPPPPPPTSDP